MSAERIKSTLNTLYGCEVTVIEDKGTLSVPEEVAEDLEKAHLLPSIFGRGENRKEGLYRENMRTFFV